MGHGKADLMSNLVFFKRIRDSVRIPARASEGSAGWDIYAHKIELDINAARATVYTGLQVAFPDSMVMCLFARSGLGSNYGLVPANGTGIIDSDYRGEIIIKFRDLSVAAIDRLRSMNEHAENGEPERVVQALFIPIVPVCLKETAYLPDTVRGDGGFGSTG